NINHLARPSSPSDRSNQKFRRTSPWPIQSPLQTLWLDPRYFVKLLRPHPIHTILCIAPCFVSYLLKRQNPNLKFVDWRRIKTLDVSWVAERSLFLWNNDQS
ncbi:unnamed protein product, partial [Linum tenue]